jgi:glucose uptake protein
MTFSIIASEQAGYAISYGLGQGATLIAALWGVFIWKEFGKAEGLKGLLVAMFLFFLLGLGMIIAARLI